MNENKLPDTEPVFSIFTDLEQSYSLGNKAALYDAVARSNATGAGLPDWALKPLQELLVEKWEPRRSRWKGNRSPLKGGYSQLLAKYLRSQVYRSAMLWVENKRHYERLPTKCVQAWYDGEFDKLTDTAAESAITVTSRGLLGTFIANNSTRKTIEKDRYFGAVPKGGDLSDLDRERAHDSKMTHAEYAAYLAENWESLYTLPLSFGYKESEVVFGFREPGQFWGPPCDPPDHICEILENEPPTMEDK